MNKTFLAFILVLLTCSLIPAAHAQKQFSFDLLTDSLQNGPYTLDIQLLDGSGMNDANNTFALTNFLFGTGGSAMDAPTRTGGVSGDVVNGVTLIDTDFFNEFLQPFTPGDSLHFNGSFTSNVDPGGIPDAFTVAILDANGDELPTTGPDSSLLHIDLDSADPTIQRYNLVGAAVATPEAHPAVIMSVMLGLMGVWLVRRKRPGSELQR